MVVQEIVARLLLSKVLERVRPQNVAHEALCRWFSESVNLQDHVSIRARKGIIDGKVLNWHAHFSSHRECEARG